MAQTKITEKETVSTIHENAHVLITQQEQQEGCATGESLRRVPLPVFCAKIHKNAPVTSVNGQTGDVKLRPPVYLVTLSNTDATNTLWCNQIYSDILEAYEEGYDVRCNYNGYLLPLKLEPGVDECVFAGTIHAKSYTVIVTSSRSAIITECSLAEKEDLPQKLSDLENDEGYLTAVTVTVTGNGDGSYEPNLTYSDLRFAHNEGKTVRCLFADDGVYLPMTADGRRGFVFSAVVNSCLYEITIPFAGGDRQPGVLVSKTDLSFSGADGLSTEEKKLLLTLFENTAYIKPDMGSTVQQLKNLWDGGTEDPSIPEKALAYWDYTMGDIRENDSFSVNAHSPAGASFTMEEEGMLIVNNSKSGYAGFMTVDTLDFSTVEVTYVVHPIEIMTPNDSWCGITFSIGYQNAITISTGHGVSVSGTVVSDYVLPSLGEDYTIRVRNGVVYVNDTLVYSQNPTEIKSAYIGLNGTMYLKSISVVPLEE